MIVTKKQLYKLLDEKREETQDFGFIVIMRYAYDWEDLSQQPWSVEPCGVYFGSDTSEDGFMWFNDWDEGQNKFEILRIITNQEMINAALASGYSFEDMEKLRHLRELQIQNAEEEIE